MLAALSCDRAVTVAIDNTSGEPIAVLVRADSDVFVTDTLAAGRTLCWPAPARMRGKTAHLSLSTRSKPLQGSSFEIPGFWFDSVKLDGNSRVLVHAHQHVPPTRAWLDSQWAAKQRADSILVAERVRVMRGGIPIPERDLRYSVDLTERAASAEAGAPKVLIRAEIVKDRACVIGE